MSRAFVKETEGVEELPEKLVSTHRNLVTEAGLARIESEVERLLEDLTAAQNAGDRDLIARVSRDLRYWNQRLASAEVQPPPIDTNTVAFGSTVTLERSDGRIQTFRIVGEDEADPAKGTLSYVAPLAQAMLGRGIGDIVKAGGGEAEIVKISR